MRMLVVASVVALLQFPGVASEPALPEAPPRAERVIEISPEPGNQYTPNAGWYSCLKWFIVDPKKYQRYCR